MNKKQIEQFNILAIEMDKRDQFMLSLREFYKKHKYIPEEYREQWEMFRREGLRSWRQQPKVLRRIKKAAIKVAKRK